jgi:hypothetical protein
VSARIDLPPPLVRDRHGGDGWAELTTVRDGREADELTAALARRRIETRTLPMPVSSGRGLLRRLPGQAIGTVRYVYVILVRTTWLEEARAFLVPWLRDRRDQLRAAGRRAILAFVLALGLALSLLGLLLATADRGPGRVEPDRPGRIGAAVAPRQPPGPAAWTA